MALSATLHCLAGCATGEVIGLFAGTAIGATTTQTVVLAFGLAFVFGYGLSILPVLRSGRTFSQALRLVLAADTLSILTMELVDNIIVAVIPGAMEAGFVNTLFWTSMALGLSLAAIVAFPVNRWLMSRGRGHALVHTSHASHGSVVGWRRFVPAPSTAVLLTGIVMFIVGGTVVSIAYEQSRSHPMDTGMTSTT